MRCPGHFTVGNDPVPTVQEGGLAPGLASEMSRSDLGPRYRGVLSWEKWRSLEVAHPPASHSRIRNEWSCTCVPPICLHGVERANFTFTYMN